MAQPAGVRACLSCVPGRHLPYTAAGCVHGISLIFSASEEQSALLRLRGRQRQAGRGRAGSQRSRGAGFISARRRRLGGRACACDASWSQNTGMGLALPH